MTMTSKNAPLCPDMGVESGIVRTHIPTSHLQHIPILEVLHGVLYPEAHGNGFKNKIK